MNKELLKKAQDGLLIRDVYIFHSQSLLMPGFDPKYDERAENLFMSFLHVVEKSEIVELNGDPDDVLFLYRVYINVGARWKYENDETEESFEENTAAKIETTYVAEYTMKEEIEQEALAEFALNNASYHVWPYWREYLMSQCMRMNLPKIPLPTQQFAGNREQPTNQS